VTTLSGRRASLVFLIPALAMLTMIFMVRNILCSTETVTRAVSPDQRYVASFKIKRCRISGSRTYVELERNRDPWLMWLNTQVRFWIPSNKLQADEVFREYAPDESVHVNWTGATGLHIRYDDSQQRFPMCRTTWGDVQVACANLKGEPSASK
jgi:hypothetical protein